MHRAAIIFSEINDPEEFTHIDYTWSYGSTTYMWEASRSCHIHTQLSAVHLWAWHLADKCAFIRTNQLRRLAVQLMCIYLLRWGYVYGIWPRAWWWAGSCSLSSTCSLYSSLPRAKKKWWDRASPSRSTSVNWLEPVTITGCMMDVWVMVVCTYNFNNINYMYWVLIKQTAVELLLSLVNQAAPCMR